MSDIVDVLGDVYEEPLIFVKRVQHQDATGNYEVRDRIKSMLLL